MLDGSKLPDDRASFPVQANSTYEITYSVWFPTTAPRGYVGRRRARRRMWRWPWLARMLRSPR
jgi:hypothetical protein